MQNQNNNNEINNNTTSNSTTTTTNTSSTTNNSNNNNVTISNSLNNSVSSIPSKPSSPTVDGSIGGNNKINGLSNDESLRSSSVALDDSRLLTDREYEIKNLVSSAEYTGASKKTIYLGSDEHKIFDSEEPQIKEDIIRMIIQYLQDEGYTASLLTIQDEANVKFSEHVYKISQMKKMKKVILEGDWNEVEKLCTKNTFKNHQSFLYAVYKQAYLELLEKQEYQKAFTYLTKRLKPLEGRQNNADEFKDLCYLLTCKSVQEVPSFKAWDGSKGTSREKLVEQFQSMLELENTKSTGALFRVPPHRLISLLKQAVTYQIEFGRYHPKVVPKIKTLLEDYSCFVLPNSMKYQCLGHRKNVKSVEFIGNGSILASGSSDNTIRLWNTENGSAISTLTGNNSRIWDLSSSPNGGFLASAAGDGVVKLWDIHTPSKPLCPLTIKAHEGDAYTVQFHPGQNHLASGGYDKAIHLFDARTGQLVKSFSGHTGSISKVIFNPHGNLIISGSKDSTIKFWDIVSGVCIKTLSSHLGEVTSIATNTSGSYLLSASKDNSNRLWDIRNARPIKRFKGHQNTSKNFIRSSFGPNETLVISGSEDGYVYIWDIETANILQKLGSPTNSQSMVYSAVWSQEQSILASCSQDSSVKIYWYDQSKPVFNDNQ
ncbi:hypothetical protein DLAC_02562 [Tieghemostelium lacteum]|uniref:WD40 repeat-containing protein SMU1 n=1 Tax=Tieghemostelium lacteum TaxID=361077 RepID=A0A152A2S7_TIELA|nr:hypothetical protein DLAC_02562 [Tieghemostelium lacteum]|eukprot:KYR00548.1 hypothetical protein DLAC_02562 [Tieghemostelium lacteum]